MSKHIVIELWPACYQKNT